MHAHFDANIVRRYDTRGVSDNSEHSFGAKCMATGTNEAWYELADTTESGEQSRVSNVTAPELW